MFTSSRLKVAILGEDFPPRGGGISTAHYSLYLQLKKSHSVKLFAFDAHEKDESIAVVKVRKPAFFGKLFESFLVRYVQRYSSKGKVDACRKIGTTAAVIRSLNREITRFSPHIIIVPDFRVPALLLKKPENSKLILVAHHNYARFRNQPLLDGPCDYDLFLASRLERRALKKCDYVVFVSEYMERVFRVTLSDSLPGEVINNSVELHNVNRSTRKAIREDLGLKKEVILVYIPSGGTQVKGARFVPEIVRRLSQASSRLAFFISGPIDYRCQVELDYLQKYLKIITPGTIKNKDNLKYVASCDLCISPAVLENYSLALMEALSMGIPCVVFDVGANREIIEDGVMGYVVDYLDIDALCAKSIKLIKNSELRCKFSLAAVERLRKLCDSDYIRRSWNDLFLMLMGREA